MKPSSSSSSSSSSSTTTTPRRSSEAERIKGKGNMGGSYQDSSISIGDGEFCILNEEKNREFQEKLRDLNGSLEKLRDLLKWVVEYMTLLLSLNDEETFDIWEKRKQRLQSLLLDQNMLSPETTLREERNKQQGGKNLFNFSLEQNSHGSSST